MVRNPVHPDHGVTLVSGQKIHKLSAETLVPRVVALAKCNCFLWEKVLHPLSQGPFLFSPVPFLLAALQTCQVFIII